MAQIDGFGKWRILDKDRNIDSEEWGIIDLQYRLFFETDESGNKTGKTLNLNFLGGWELITNEEN